jgi:hypothetical protein
MSTLTSHQENIRDFLPASYGEIVEEFNVSRSTARDHIAELRRKGVSVGRRRDGPLSEYYVRNEEGEHPTNDNSVYGEVTRNKTSKSERLNTYLRGMEQRLTEMLDRTAPPVADGSPIVNESNEDVVIHRTDTHFGDVLENEFGEVVFDSNIARKREEYVTERVMELVERQEQAGVTYDTAHLLLGGDHVTGENIYQNQQAEIEEGLDEQLEAATEVFLEQIQRLAARFPAVQVVCQVGNHGALEASYSNGANADRFMFMMLDQAVRSDPNLDNVTLVRNNSTKFTNFYVRGDRQTYENNDQGWKFHLRHGDDSLEHIGTSAGKKRWRGWKIRHEFDQAYRGHYHQFAVDSLYDGGKVLMTGSPKPSDEFEESLSEWSVPSATVHGVSDSRKMTWMYPVTF